MTREEDEPCARCDHEYGNHDRRDGHCLQFADDLIGVPGICGCPRFVWPDDVFTVEVSP